jgi:hypothetical protein
MLLADFNATQQYNLYRILIFLALLPYADFTGSAVCSGVETILVLSGFPFQEKSANYGETRI